jgi:hypothetical protein
LLIEDLATSPTSKLHRGVRGFRARGSAWRLANQLLSHPDHPQKFIEWSDYGSIVSRANEFLGAGNRLIATPLPRRGDLDLLKRVRNAVAHRTDKAWESFLSLCRSPPIFHATGSDERHQTRQILGYAQLERPAGFARHNHDARRCRTSLGALKSKRSGSSYFLMRPCRSRPAFI